MATSTERSLAARVAAHSQWAKTTDRTARLAAARQGLMDRFAREVDPTGALDPAERAERAESARKAHYARMALASARARRERAEGRRK